MKRKWLLWLFLGIAPAWAEDAGQGAQFQEGRGVLLSADTKAAIGLTVADVTEAVLTSNKRLIGQVYRAANEGSQNLGERAGFAYASAMVKANNATDWESNGTVTFDLDGGVTTGRIVAVNRTMLEAGGQLVEVQMEIADTNNTLKIGAFVHARPTGNPTAPVTVVPRSAILETAQATFVYVSNGDAFLRTLVTIGVHGEQTVEIVDGLFAGDSVAASAVEMLYLIELRATKGGGHCH